METLAQVKTQVLNVLQSTTANAQLSSLVDSSFKLSLLELTRAHDFACCSRLVPVTLSPGVCYDRQGGFSVKTKAFLTILPGGETAELRFSSSFTKYLWLNRGKFSLASHTISLTHPGVTQASFGGENTLTEGGTSSSSFYLGLSDVILELILNGQGDQIWDNTSFVSEVVVTLSWSELNFKKLRYVLDHKKSPVELTTFANTHGFGVQAVRHNIPQHTRNNLLAVNSEIFEYSGEEIDGYLYGTVEVPSWETFEGQLLLKAAIDFVFWNAVTQGNYLVGVFLPRQEGALDPPEIQKATALQGIITDDSYLERQSFTMSNSLS